MTLPQRSYQELAQFRYLLRSFLKFSEEQAREHQLEPQHHQALLALKGLPTGTQPTIHILADRLLLRHHSTVELVNRLAADGLVKRTADPHDRRQILLRLTSKANAKLRALALAHQEELRVKGPDLTRALRAILRESRSSRLR